MKERLVILENFWLSKLPYGIYDEKFDAKIKNAKAEFVSEELQNKALIYWSIMLYNIGELSVTKQENSIIIKPQQIISPAIVEINPKEEIHKQIIKFLELPNDLSKIELTLNQITTYRKI